MACISPRISARTGRRSVCRSSRSSWDPMRSATSRPTIRTKATSASTVRRPSPPANRAAPNTPCRWPSMRPTQHRLSGRVGRSQDPRQRLDSHRHYEPVRSAQRSGLRDHSKRWRQHRQDHCRRGPASSRPTAIALRRSTTPSGLRRHGYILQHLRDLNAPFVAGATLKLSDVATFINNGNGASVDSFRQSHLTNSTGEQNYNTDKLCSEAISTRWSPRSIRSPVCRV